MSKRLTESHEDRINALSNRVESLREELDAHKVLRAAERNRAEELQKRIDDGIPAVAREVSFVHGDRVADLVEEIVKQHLKAGEHDVW